MAKAILLPSKYASNFSLLTPARGSVLFHSSSGVPSYISSMRKRPITREIGAVAYTKTSCTVLLGRTRRNSKPFFP